MPWRDNTVLISLTVHFSSSAICSFSDLQRKSSMLFSNLHPQLTCSFLYYSLMLLFYCPRLQVSATR